MFEFINNVFTWCCNRIFEFTLGFIVVLAACIILAFPGAIILGIWLAFAGNIMVGLIVFGCICSWVFGYVLRKEL